MLHVTLVIFCSDILSCSHLSLNWSAGHYQSVHVHCVFTIHHLITSDGSKWCHHARWPHSAQEYSGFTSGRQSLIMSVLAVPSHMINLNLYAWCIKLEVLSKSDYWERLLGAERRGFTCQRDCKRANHFPLGSFKDTGVDEVYSALSDF